MAEAFAHLLRHHRARLRWSQEQLGLAAEVSPRHLSCLETAKARPSREMVLFLARVLELELRQRNALLVSAGFAAVYPTTAIDGVAMAPVNRAIGLVLAQQEPYGAVVIDRCWNVLRVNNGALRLLGAFLDPSTVPPLVAGNLARATLHPDGLRRHVVNCSEVAAVLLDRVERAHHAHPEDEERRALFEEVRSYPGVDRLAAKITARRSSRSRPSSSSRRGRPPAVRTAHDDRYAARCDRAGSDDRVVVSGGQCDAGVVPDGAVGRDRDVETQPLAARRVLVATLRRE